MVALSDDLAAMAAANHGLLYVDELRASGHSQREIRSLVRRLARVHRGAYLVASDSVAEDRAAARIHAVMRGRGGVTASHTSAAILHGLAVSPKWLDVVHLTGNHPEVKGAVRSNIHLHGGPLPSGSTTTAQGLPVTSLERTIIDCARIVNLPEAVIIADQGLRTSGASRRELAALLDSYLRARGTARVRRVIGLADPGAESPGESRVRLIVVHGGFPTQSQVTIRTLRNRFVGRVDLLLRGHGVFVEFDGRGKYGMDQLPEAAHWKEKQRHDALVELGLEGVRVTWNELAKPREILTRIQAAVNRAGERARGDGAPRFRAFPAHPDV